MLIALKTTLHLILSLEKFKAKDTISKNPSLWGLSRKTKSRLVEWTLFCLAPSLLSQEKLFAKILKKRSGNIDKKILGIRKKKPRLPELTQSRVQKEKLKWTTSTLTKKVIMQTISFNLQKTYVDLKNFYAGIW